MSELDVSLGGLRILSCRQVGRGGELDAQIETAGGVIVRLPLIEVRPPPDSGAALRDALERLDTFDWVACTSVNGVEALAGVELPAGLRLAAVGPATAEAFTSVVGRSALVVPSVHTAQGLVAGFPPRPGRVLTPLAELASRYPQLTFGSYPFQRKGVHGTNLLARGQDVAALDAALAEMTELFG